MIQTSTNPTKHRSLETAITLFSKHGYNGVSMRDIANAVGISPPALYNHFANKDALYREAVSATFESKSRPLLDAMSFSEDPLACLEHFITIMVTEMQRDRRFHKLMQWEMLDADETRLAFLGSFICSRVQQPFMQLLEMLKPDCDTFLLSEMIFGMAKQHYDSSSLHPFVCDGQEAERSAEQLARLMMDVLTPFFNEPA
ncbi:MAG: TetR/AcrR family transcriptional regulator [Gammaproteobacteria bacterium]|nr:TetR/AcrR family transcriptional regulator [Gammaproteobacteria bacterium]